jgi:hypothetical protein
MKSEISITRKFIKYQTSRFQYVYVTPQQQAPIPAINTITSTQGMAPRKHPSYPQLATFLSKLSLPPRNLHKSHSTSSGDTKNDIMVAESCEDGPPDEGFHEEWPPFGPSDLMQFMTYKQCMSKVFEMVSNANSFRFHKRMVGVSAALLSLRDC